MAEACGAVSRGASQCLVQYLSHCCSGGAYDDGLKPSGSGLKSEFFLEHFLLLLLELGFQMKVDVSARRNRVIPPGICVTDGMRISLP